MKLYIQRFIIAIFIIIIGLFIYYYVPISSMVLENLDFKNKLSLEDAESIVSEENVEPLYSWYSMEGVIPVIKVMGQYEKRTGESTIHAFSGDILFSNIIEYAQQHPSHISQNPGIDESLYQQIIALFPEFELIKTETIQENNIILETLYLWVNDHYTQVVVEKNTHKILEVHEKFWKGKDATLENTGDVIAPTVSISYPTQNMVIPHEIDSIDVVVTVTDNIDPSPEVVGTGKYSLQDGFNKIIVVAMDKDKNTSSAFVIVERLSE